MQVNNFFENTPIQRNYSFTEKQLKFLMINCPFCKHQFIYEFTMLFHINTAHLPKSKLSKRKQMTNEYSLLKIASALKKFTIINTDSIFHLLLSYDCRIDNKNDLEKIIISNIEKIQKFLQDTQI